MISLQSLTRAVGYSLSRMRSAEIAAEQARRAVEEQRERERQEAEDERKRAAQIEAERLARERLEAERATQALRASMHARDTARGREWRAAHLVAVRAAEDAARRLALQEAAERQAREAMEAEQRQRQRSELLAELERRRAAELDPDGSVARAKKARDEQLEQERLGFLAAQLVRRTA